jgi:molybdate transport system substrate-binding protein
MKKRVLLTMLAAVVISSVCMAKEITVAAAADLVIAFKEIGTMYEKDNRCKVNLIFSSSGTAKEQILNGAPYDVYASANVKFVDELIEKGAVIPDSKELYAIGRVGIAVSKNSSLKIIKADDLLKNDFKKIAMANPDHAPYGLAAKEALISLGLWDKIKDKLVYGKDIQDTLSLIKTGNADAGFISLSVVNKNDVNFLILDDKLHKPLRQAIAVTKFSKEEAESRKFIKYVNGIKGREVMKKYGFILPGELK